MKLPSLTVSVAKRLGSLVGQYSFSGDPELTIENVTCKSTTVALPIIRQP